MLSKPETPGSILSTTKTGKTKVGKILITPMVRWRRRKKRGIIL